ncbi:MAG: hypothetical protein BGP05_05105 [Rhizobiales bacterium 62-47]|jgi:hypothetical protein|uniref:hypothetical protein n=1 Tax=Afipia sp. 1NLS2 TaxID=666684 RepID=UPI0001D9E602|nr:hypothetical protein [Afipia sp. 1NLS2]EFI52920.1 conserved hypothetical protein [Afipia sp. 1NLS2]MBN9043074.1 hypothetical protein [Hyphomicrobiales bacterium]MCO5131459.1 hypothetical protein [Xanthobacteraceae bacterium]OJY09115.1 MAG: hypothetical protein BGP05_05105 [Rhizobiales bacterium 62-47]
MSAQIGAIVAAVGSVARGIFGRKLGAFAGVALAAMTLGGCAVPLVPLVGADPADPGAKVAGVGYRSTLAPYTSLRPTTPSNWKEQNQRVTPSPNSSHEH